MKGVLFLLSKERRRIFNIEHRFAEKLKLINNPYLVYSKDQKKIDAVRVIPFPPEDYF
jgi:hypothetical protein